MANVERLVVGLYDRGEGTQTKILDIGNPKILKSGMWSPYLVNFRPAFSFDRSSTMAPGEQRGIRDELVESYSYAVWGADEHYRETEEGMIDFYKFSHAYGAPEAGTPLAAAVAVGAGVSLIWGRVGGDKSYGSHQKLEGTYQSGENVVIIDDVVTDAATKVESKLVLEAAGLEVTDVVVGFDRQQGGREGLEANGMRLTAVMTAIGAFEALRENNRITTTELDFLKQYTLSPPIYEEPVDHPWKVA